MPIEKIKIPSVEELNRYLEVDFINGKLFWKERTPDMFKKTPEQLVSRYRKSQSHSCKVWNKRFANTEAFTSVSNTYKSGTINKISYKAHRIIFKMYHGYDPDEVDHIDGDPFNNSISNLRESDRSTNMKNSAMQHDNTSGQTGVTWDKSRGKWSARIECDKHVYHLGRYETFEEACAVRKQAEEVLGFHENHGSRKSKIREFVQSRKKAAN